MRLFSRKYSINSYIKEAVDNLPIGICFFDSTGILVLCNHKMYQLSIALSRRDLQHITDIQNMMRDPAPGVKILDEEKTLFSLEDKVWQILLSEIQDKKGNSYMQVTAADVTELYQLQRELEHDTQQQKQIAKRLQELRANVVELSREEEALKLKMRIHDDIGRSVVASKRLLEKKLPVSELNISLWREAVNVLQRDNSAKPQANMLEQLQNAAEAIGVKIILTGELCGDMEIRYLLIVVMRECMTNTVRHAKGDELYVTIRRANRQIEAVLTNNGRTPEQEIAEGGGLSSLRRRIEKKGGRMRIQSKPVFQLTVLLPEKGDRL